MIQKRFIKYAVAGVLILAMLVSVFALSHQDGSLTAEAVDTGAGTPAYLSPDGGIVPDSETVTGIPADPILSVEDIPDQDDATEPSADAPTEGMTAQDTTAEEPTDEATESTAPETDAPLPTEEITEQPTYAPDYVGEVHTIVRTDPAEGMIKLEWNAAEGAHGYHIYWRDADAQSEAFSLLSTVKDTALTIRNLKKGCMYYFKIAGYKALDGKLYDGDSAVLKAGTTPVEATGFHLASGVPTGTLLKWNRNDLCDGYILYRQFEGKWNRLQVLPRDTTEYRDTDVIPGKAYNYRLSTYRMDATGELESSPLLVRTVCGLCAPADNGTTELLCKVYLKWKKNAYADGYEIRCSEDNTTYEVLVDTKSTSYTTDRLTKGKTYSFRIFPYRYLDGGKTKVLGTYMGKTITVNNTAYGKEVPSTYIEVNISKQHMWYYVDGKVYVSTDVVTGNYNSMDTPKGYWEVNSKASPCTLVGDGYVSYVTYWIAFIGSGYGIHDASWRSSYGGTIYKGDGSHGCVNTPYNAVKKIYEKVKIGTPVIVY